MEMPFIDEDEFLLMRPLTISDSQLVVDWRNNPRVRQRYIYREAFTLAGQNRYFHEKVESGEVAQFIFCEKESMRPIGCAVLDDVPFGIAECGNWIGEDWATGKGYSPRMIRMVCRYGFTVLGLREIVARIFCDNPASIKSYERAGFAAAGFLPDVERSDQSRDDMLFLRLQKEDYE